MHKETVTWEEDNEGLVPSTKMTPGALPVNGHALDGTTPDNRDIEKDPQGTVPTLKTPDPQHAHDHAALNAKEGTISEDSSGATAVAVNGAAAVHLDHPSAVADAKDVELPPQSPTEQPKLEKLASEGIEPTDVVSELEGAGFTTCC